MRVNDFSRAVGRSVDIVSFVGDGEQLRQARLKAGMTQEELAARSGVAQPNIGAYETGRRKPSAAMVHRIMRRRGRAHLRCCGNTAPKSWRWPPPTMPATSEFSGRSLAARTPLTATSICWSGLRTGRPSSTWSDSPKSFEAMLGVHVDVLSEMAWTIGTRKYAIRRVPYDGAARADQDYITPLMEFARDKLSSTFARLSPWVTGSPPRAGRLR